MRDAPIVLFVGFVLLAGLLAWDGDKTSKLEQENRSLRRQLVESQAWDWRDAREGRPCR